MNVTMSGVREPPVLLRRLRERRDAGRGRRPVAHASPASVRWQAHGPGPGSGPASGAPEPPARGAGLGHEPGRGGCPRRAPLPLKPGAGGGRPSPLIPASCPRLPTAPVWDGHTAGRFTPRSLHPGTAPKQLPQGPRPRPDPVRHAVPNHDASSRRTGEGSGARRRTEPAGTAQTLRCRADQ